MSNLRYGETVPHTLEDSGLAGVWISPLIRTLNNPPFAGLDFFACADQQGDGQYCDGACHASWGLCTSIGFAGSYSVPSAMIPLPARSPPIPNIRNVQGTAGLCVILCAINREVFHGALPGVAVRFVYCVIVPARGACPQSFFVQMRFVEAR